MYSPVQILKVCSKRIVKLRRILLHELQPIAVGKSSELDKRVLWEKSTDVTEGQVFVRSFVRSSETK